MKRLVFIMMLFILAYPAIADASSPKAVHITETTPVYKETGKVAVFLKGTSHAVIKESDKYYYTAIGGEEVKFSKQRATLSQESPGNWKAVHPVRAKTTGVATILEKPSLQAKTVGTIQKNETVHLQRMKGNYYPINVGGKTGYIRKDQIQIQPGIPVLMYHDIVERKVGNNASELELKKFKEQMAYLKKNGWTTITPAQLEHWVEKKGTLPAKSVLITFDDGYVSTVDLAYPILKEYGFQATSFLITSRIGRAGMVTEEDIRNTQDVYSYQNHTHRFHMFNTMTNLSIMQSESRYAIAADLQEANEAIEPLLTNGSSVYAHAYPYGKYSKEAVQALADSHISIAFTINEGNVYQGDPIYALNRQRVHSAMTIQEFANKLIGK
ncbi:polysaccharide deacetylase family protein [Sporosarcina cyprini]|uniref:polysaccharide deacetylase family protein n=1 Tax=Sporosarcina cyprini TaxID=2910523 RepID=UPI001EDE862C|nr:polysaccharide deacetylase family protein [Sporosarcina cyprini]MCG3088141.1 polysaccharide deacetylase family protein [Sporosarcina cyprini]